MNANKRLRLGIIGCGRVAGERHLPALRCLPDVQLAAVADINTDQLSRFADLCGITRCFTDYRQLLDCSDIEAVGIFTPTASHAEIVMASLDANKHVMIEKPLALNLAECERLISRASSSSCKVLVGLNLRWHRLLQRARKLIQDGELGRIKSIRSVFTHYRTGEDAPDWHRKRDSGGGVIFNEAVHHFDLWRYLLDTDVEQIFSYALKSPHYEDETLVACARLSGGALATGIFTLKTSPNNELEIYGEKGRLLISLYRYDGIDFFSHDTYPGSIPGRIKASMMRLIDLPEAIPVMRQGGDFAATFHNLWRHFTDCIFQDRPPACGLEEGMRALRISLAAAESATSKLPISLKA